MEACTQIHTYTILMAIFMPLLRVNRGKPVSLSIFLLHLFLN